MAKPQTGVTKISTENVTEDEKNCRLTGYFRHLLNRRINFRLTRDETIDIMSSVDFLVQTLVTKVTSKVLWLPFSRVIRVGSMAEETSIGTPNEFDYLAILQIEHDGVEVEQVCENRKGYAHVKVIDRFLRSMWGKWLDGVYLKSDFTRGDSDMLSGYFDTLGNAFQNEVENVIFEYDEKLINKTEIGTMTVSACLASCVKKHGPAFTPKFNWVSRRRGEKITVSVDITLAVEMDLAPDLISEKDVFHPKFLAEIEKRGKYMLISSRNYASCEARLCFHLTFTEAEVELVRSLSQHHKECYKLMKYVFNSRKGYTFFPSYAWKTLILKHNCICDETENLAVCFKNLVATCLHYLFHRKTEEKIELSRIARLFMPGEKFRLRVPSVFFKEYNIFDDKNFKFPCEQFLTEIEIMLHSIDNISCKANASMDDLKVVNSRGTGVEAYVKSVPTLTVVPFVGKKTELTKCLECYRQYFCADIT